MKIKAIIIVTIIMCLGYTQTVKRGRNEGTLYIPSSNVMGNGNITAYIDLSGRLTSEELEAGTRIGTGIGIADILQFNAQTSFINFNKFGPTEAHLQATMPGNNRLRFFGFAIIGDIYLSTSLDTTGEDADFTKPQYKSYPQVSAIMDFDWLSLPVQLPIKTYIFVSLADNPRLLYEYKQIAFKAGIEWKKYKHSFFVDAGFGFYKAKHIRNADYDQIYGWISPGGRYRIGNRFSFLGNINLTFYRDIVKNGLLNPEILSILLKFEAPILFRETDTEAIRTLVFMEKKEKEESKQFTKDIESEKSLLGKFEKTLDDLEGEGETFDYKKEEGYLVRQREKIQEKMDQIESLLKEDSKE